MMDIEQLLLWIAASLLIAALIYLLDLLEAHSFKSGGGPLPIAGDMT